MDITGFSDIDFLLFGSCDVASADFCTGLEHQPNVCTPQPGSVQVSSAWLEQSSCIPWAVWISCRICLQEKLARLWKGHISSSCEECGKGFNFWLNCCWALCFPFHSLRQLLASFRYLCCCSAAKASGTAQCSVQNNTVFNKAVSD